MNIANDWKDYALLDAGGGEKLERWGRYILRRPDPQAIWPPVHGSSVWERADARYHRSASGGGRWEYVKKVPERWIIQYRDLAFHIEPTGFKHTGLFPEQAVNWDWMADKIKQAGYPVRVLNLFGYTGGATVATAAAGAEVCHVDAAKRMVQRAKENMILSKLGEARARYITDDVLKFIQREERRKSFYDAIIMDPPSYGRGPNGEVWKLEDTLYDLIAQCARILTPDPLFMLVNTYTTGFSPTVTANMLAMNLKKRIGRVSCGEVGLPVADSSVVLPCGAYARWEAGSA